MRPVLIREGDYYVGLRQRINKARKYKADLFISIHADGFKDQRARGSSVYVITSYSIHYTKLYEVPPSAVPATASARWRQVYVWGRGR